MNPLKIVLFIFTAAHMSMAHAEKGQSIMFGEPEGYKTKSPIESVNESDDTCAELARKIEQLKGKPQQKFAMKQRFDAECVRESGPDDLKNPNTP